MAFKDLVKQQRQQGSGILSSVGSAAVGTARESLDIRNALFKSGSFLNTLFPNVKGFKAENNVSKGKSPSILSTLGSDMSSSKLDEIGQNTKIAAKNSFVLPAMARDMNVMRQNIVKLVKVQGVAPSTKADMFFMKAGEREAAYESRMNKPTPTPTPTPTKQKETSSSDLGIGTIISGILAAITTLGPLLTGAISLIVSGVSALGTLVAGAISTLAGAVVSAITSLGKVLGDILLKIPGLIKSALPLAAPLATAAAPLVALAAVTQQAESADIKSEEFNIFGSTAKNAKGFSDWFNETFGRDKKFDEMREKSREGLTSPYSAPQTKTESTSSSAPTTAPTPVGAQSATTSQNNNGDLVSFIKSTEGFRPNAYWDHDQYSIGYGTKASSSNEVIDEIEAERRLIEEIKKRKDYVIGFGKKHKYNWNEKQIDALTSFAYNVGSLDQLTQNGKRSNEEISQKMMEYNKASGKILPGLVSRRSAEVAMFNENSVVTDSGTKLASAVPPSNNVGTSINAGSVQVADARMNMGSGQSVVVNAPQTNVQAPQGVQRSSGNIPSVVDTDFMRHLVAQLAT